MKHIKIQCWLACILLLSLVGLFGVTPTLKEVSEVHFPPLLLSMGVVSTSALIYLCTVAVWLGILMAHGLPDAKLLSTPAGRRELLWRLADSREVRHKGPPWWTKKVMSWLAYRGAPSTPECCSGTA